MENNTLIAEFMGATLVDWVDVEAYDFKEIPCIYKVDEMKYSTSWNWLMPVVEKIESLGYWVAVQENIVTISDRSQSYHWYGGRTSDSKLISTYIGVVEFIKWYNTHKHA